MIVKVFVGIVIVGLVKDITVAGLDAEWGYGKSGLNPSQWHTGYPRCAGKEQSPVNIQPSEMVRLRQLTRLRFNGTAVGNCTLTNLAHTVECIVDSSISFSVTGGPFSYNYRLAQFHIHFGSDSSQGSEHRIRGRSFPAEVHFVFYNSDRFTGVGPAHLEPHGLAVIGAFVDTGRFLFTNTEFNKITNRAQSVKYEDNNIRIPNIDVSKLMPNTHYYATYTGSLTTPPCAESVTWVLLKRRIHSTERQLDQLRSNWYSGKSASDPGHKMANNFRPTQPLNGRFVFFN